MYLQLQQSRGGGNLKLQTEIHGLCHQFWFEIACVLCFVKISVVSMFSRTTDLLFRRADNDFDLLIREVVSILHDRQSMELGGGHNSVLKFVGTFHMLICCLIFHFSCRHQSRGYIELLRQRFFEPTRALFVPLGKLCSPLAKF